MKPLFLFCWLVLAQVAFAETVVFEKVGAGQFGKNLLENNEGRAYETYGRAFSITLNQKTPLPIRATAESRSEGVSGGISADYSIYIDIIYDDGTPQWGITVPFTMKKEWESRSVEFLPVKPIRSLTMYLMFRNREGKVWFRNPTFAEARVEGNAVPFFTFDGWPVCRKTSLEANKMHYCVRDVSQEGDWILMEKQGELWQGAGIAFDGKTVRNLKGGDRCVTLACVLPFSEKMTTLFPELGISEPVSASEAGFLSYTPAGMKKISRLPLLGVGNANGEHWIGIDPDRPALFRLFYNPEINALCATFDLGFVEGNDACDLSVFTFDQPSGGMRTAWNTYMKRFPAAFALHLPKDETTGKYPQGNWMPFAPISVLPRFEDFGFRFKEGNTETKWDDEHAILTYRYTEPMTWWMPLKEEEILPGEDVLEAGVRKAEKMAAEGKNLLAAGWKNSVMHGADGKPAGRYLDTPWCKGIVWSMNSAPGVAAPSDFSSKWNPDVAKWYYESPERGDQDGEYIDSSEGYVTAVMDFRQEHLRVAKTPLTFDGETKRPVMFRGLVTYEYVRKISEEVRARGKSMMANSTPIQLFWLAPLLDIMGTETNWNRNGQWTPMSVRELRYRRMLCGKKPFCFLQNTDFTKFSHELAEKYMRRALAFGMFPGFFSADASTGQYFRTPELYERDRPLFQKYLPLCRMVAEAGWESETGATVDVADVCVERFGDYFTLFNPTDKPVTCHLKWDVPRTIRNVWLGQVGAEGTITLGAEEVLVLEATR
ncbi:MAG: hypothetical protein Q4D98_07240 [Planctomycetia bacterium]|nr:hypothetical protein [Planctomycetia bacterium]